MKSPYRVSTHGFDTKLIHDFLRNSYWAKDIPRAVVLKSFKHSLCFGAFHEGRQVGFGRVITDRATFAYVADVFVVPEHRGKGVAKLLLRAMLDHSELQGLRRWMLATLDAHKLYEEFGFAALSNPERYMTIHQPDVYHNQKKTRRGAKSSPK